MTCGPWVALGVGRVCAHVRACNSSTLRTVAPKFTAVSLPPCPLSLILTRRLPRPFHIPLSPVPTAVSPVPHPPHTLHIHTHAHTAQNGELSQLCELASLREVSLSGVHLVTDAGLRALGRLGGLRSLRLRGLRKLDLHAAQAYMRQVGWAGAQGLAGQEWRWKRRWEQW